MFTGIITACGDVVSHEGDALWLRLPALTSEPDGASIAINGCCLTIAGRLDDQLRFDLLPNTRARTNLGALEPGDRVNAEPALRVGDRMGGHWVQGHVDCVGHIAAREQRPDATVLTIELPAAISRLCMQLGSITVDGVSLTIMEITPPAAANETGVITVQLIPETCERTTLGERTEGDAVNIEADVLAKYVQQLMQPNTGAPSIL